MVGVEPAIVIVLAAAASWAFYRFFLKDLSQERHRLFRALFYNLLTYLIAGVVIFASHMLLEQADPSMGLVSRVLPYSAFINIALAAVIVVKILRIAAYNFLFFNSRKAGVPQLLVNIFTLLLSLFAMGLILTEIFEVKIASVMATSAVLSVVLGLALQDTLGNLFAAISLQIDKPFSLGDWIELRNGSERIAGLVSEISWRATVLTAITDETLTIPNRMLAQWQILNFSGRERPFARSLVFRFHFGTDVEKARKTLFQALVGEAAVLKYPEPLCMISETTESWIAMKLVYFIEQYGSQYAIADRIYTRALALLEENNLPLASQRIVIDRHHPAHARPTMDPTM